MTRAVMINTIVSGGQTGADRAALDVALAWGLNVRGWVPRGRLAEDGVIPDTYPNLRETEGAEVDERTRLNVRDADGSLIISHGALSGGSALAHAIALELRRPVLHLDLTRLSMADAVTTAAAWVSAHHIRWLGVGGPRASADPLIHLATTSLVSGLLGHLLAGS
jgi:hypothetical protein